MSVILEGMELPVCCRGCVMYDTMSCRWLRRDVYRHAAITKDRPEDCPLRPIPEPDSFGGVVRRLSDEEMAEWIARYCIRLKGSEADEQAAAWLAWLRSPSRR